MTAPRDYRLYIQDIFEAIDAIEHYIDGYTYDQFTNDRKTKDAVVRNLEIIGEAVKHLPDEFRVAHPHIDWRPAAAMRDFLIHQYPDIDPEVVWNTVKNDIPLLKSGIKSVL